MIRPLIFCTLLGASAIVLAQPLYKWVEADGSITFSVEAPPKGVKYETINTAASIDAKTPLATEAMRSQMAPAAQQIMPSVPPAEPAQRVAPQLGVASSRPRDTQLNSSPANNIQRSTSQRGGIQRRMQPGAAAQSSSGVVGSVSGIMENTAGEQSPAVAARSRKQRQCEDLRKRVISLERRLKTRLTPEDMDNTVVHMARYQRSYDQHCVQ